MEEDGLVKINNALISVADKTGVVDFAIELAAMKHIAAGHGRDVHGAEGGGRPGEEPTG